MPARPLELSEVEERVAPAGVTAVRPLSGGASSLTYLGLLEGDESRRVVVKVAPPGVPPVRNRDVLRQARVLRALRPTPVPVPEVIWEDRGNPPDFPPLFVTTFVEGSSFEPLFDADGGQDEGEVAEVMGNAGRVLAALHALSPVQLGLGGEPAVGAAAEIDRWCDLLDTVDPRLAPDWPGVAQSLRSALPPPAQPALVHGDFRLGNMLTVGTRIGAVVDWEIWSVGDPRVDLGWFLVNAEPATYQRPTRFARSLPGPAELAAIYAEALGREVPDQGWFQALACFKSTATWSLIVKHNRRRRGPDPALEEMAGVLPHLLRRAEAYLS